MKLFYTVISKEGSIQQEPSMSLGGFKSSSVVPNGSDNNLFPDISPFTLKNNMSEYIGLILENKDSKVYNQLKFWIDAPETSPCNYKVSVVELTNFNEMESIPTRNSKPFNANFYETSRIDPIIIEGKFSQYSSVGIWVERKIKDRKKETPIYNSNIDHLEICNLKIEYI